MDVLTFIAEIVKALAWPVATIIIVGLFRRPISQLLPLLQKFKYKEFEAEFGRKIEEAKAEAAVAIAEAAPRRALPPGPDDLRFIKLAEISPRAAVLEAFTAVEIEAIAAARRLGMDDNVPKSLTFRALTFLEKSGRVDSTLIKLLRHLRDLRNKAAHAPDFALTTDAAIEYVQLADAAIEYLRALPAA